MSSVSSPLIYHLSWKCSSLFLSLPCHHVILPFLFHAVTVFSLVYLFHHYTLSYSPFYDSAGPLPFNSIVIFSFTLCFITIFLSAITSSHHSLPPASPPLTFIPLFITSHCICNPSFGLLCLQHPKLLSWNQLSVGYWGLFTNFVVAPRRGSKRSIIIILNCIKCNGALFFSR